MREQAAPLLEKQKNVLEQQGLNVATKMVAGLPHIDLNRIADEENCSLIAIGSHGRSTAGDYLLRGILGGVAAAVIQSATKPVLLLRLEPTGEGDSARCAPTTCNLREHVLFPTDFSDNADQAFAYVEKLATSGAKRITLLHVQDQTRIEKHLTERLDEFNRIDQGRLERLRTRVQEIADVSVNIRIPYGRPAEEILKIAGELEPDGEIVMGSQGRGFWAQVFLGSVSEKVASRAPTPVLLVPAPR